MDDDTIENKEPLIITAASREPACCLVRWYRRYIAVPKSCYLTEGVLITYGIVDAAVLSLLVTYLTNIRNLSILMATITVHLMDFICGLSAIVFTLFPDSGDYLAISAGLFVHAIIYIVGLGLLCLSDFSYLSRSNLLYQALLVVAVAKAAPCSAQHFLELQLKTQRNNDDEDTNDSIRETISVTKCKIIGGILGNTLLVIVTNWTSRFVISASLIAVASGSLFLQTLSDLEGENTLSRIETSSRDRDDDHEVKKQKRTNRYTFAIISAFFMYGVLESIGGTFFLEQGETMDKSLGGPNNPAIPLNLLLIVMHISSFSSKQLIEKVKWKSLINISFEIRIGIGLLFSVVTCCIAQWVEFKRLRVVKDYDLVEKPDLVVPMSVLWLLPQFITLGAMKGLAGDGLVEIFQDILPDSKQMYVGAFCQAVIGTGTFLAAMLVITVSEASKLIGGSSRWIADTANRSHLDLFYGLLSIMCLLNVFYYAYVSS